MLDSLDTLIGFTLIMLVVSLLITIAVQMVSSALNLRGLNLAKGLRTTFETILVGADKGKTEKIVNEILKGPMISDSSFMKNCPAWWRLATAVRPDEVFTAIHRIALRETPAAKSETDQLKEYAKDLLAALGMDRNALGAAGGKIDEVFQKFQYWCEMSQERVQQWFTMHTRFLTVVFALIFTVLFQLDTAEIFKLVSTNHTVRDKLVAEASTITRQAEKVLADSNSVQQEALKTFKANQTGDIKTALDPVKVESSDTRESLVKKVNDALAPIQGKEQKVVGDFDATINNVASGQLNKMTGDFKAVKADLDKTGFELIPASGKGRWGEKWSDGPWGQHFGGLLLSIALLSLGAPFWYNVLKGLTSLRSTVAGNMSDEQKQAKQQPDASTAKAPPPV